RTRLTKLDPAARPAEGARFRGSGPSARSAHPRGRGWGRLRRRRGADPARAKSLSRATRCGPSAAGLGPPPPPRSPAENRGRAARRLEGRRSPGPRRMATTDSHRALQDSTERGPPAPKFCISVGQILASHLAKNHSNTYNFAIQIGIRLATHLAKTDKHP